MELQDFVGDNDLANKRVMTLDNGAKLIFERKDPYGFWSIHYEKGQVPEDLQGHYTTFDLAQKDVARYLARKDKEVVEIQDKKKQ